MEESESIQTMFGRFQTIVNKLFFLGRTYENSDHIDKLLQSLPRKWRPQVTALRVSKNLEKLSLEELIGLLKVHELELQQDDAGRKQKSIALNVQKTKSTPSSSKALKTDDMSDENCNEGTCDTDDEISFLSRKIHSILKKKGGIRWRKYNNTPIEKAQSLCYECKKPGHYKTECLELKKEKEKEKKKTKNVQSWYLESGCSRHMTGKRSMFLDLKSKRGGQVTFGGGQKGLIMGIGKIGINSSISIDNVLYVKGLTHNLLSISQLCDSGYEVSFNKNKCTVSQPDSSVLFYS
uniref:CCHC-type domain-containing protein n=1 Tax=Cajanus cajan TaxID=3821 RepID=A0A151RDG2_CAJCA|nr:hypothetical protein KK1_038044 [Cajanus cajan]